MSIDISTLPDDSDQLKQMLLDFQDHHDKETDILLEQIRHLRAQLFGRKSEKTPVEGGPMPLPLFDMPEPKGTKRLRRIFRSRPTAAREAAESPCRLICHGLQRGPAS